MLGVQTFLKSLSIYCQNLCWFCWSRD